MLYEAFAIKPRILIETLEQIILFHFFPFSNAFLNQVFKPKKNNEIPKVKMIETHSHFPRLFFVGTLSLCSLHICISETIWNNLSWLNGDKTRLYTYPTYHKSYNTFE